jgi:hypothetical protein
VTESPDLSTGPFDNDGCRCTRSTAYGYCTNNDNPSFNLVEDACRERATGPYGQSLICHLWHGECGRDISANAWRHHPKDHGLKSLNARVLMRLAILGIVLFQLNTPLVGDCVLSQHQNTRTQYMNGSDFSHNNEHRPVYAGW